MERRSVPPPPTLEPDLGPRTTDNPFDETRFVAGVDGTKLFVRSSQDSPPQALRSYFCDGIGCDGFIWKYLFERIHAVTELTHWHYRGHGRSAFPLDAERCSIEDNAGDLNAVRAELSGPLGAGHVGKQGDVLFGHSMGVQVALEAYHREPDNVRAMVLLCGSSGKVTHTFRNVPILEALLPPLTRFVEKYPDVIRAAWSRVPHEMALKIALKMGDFDSENFKLENVLPYMEHMSNVDIPFFLRMLASAGVHSADEHLAAIKVPVLVLAGENDTFTPAWLSRQMAERIPNAEYVEIKGGSHVSPIEQPTLVADHVDEFLRKHLA